MPARAVIDTNIWISALIAPVGVAAKLVELWKRGRFDLVVSEQQMAELADVFARPRFSKYNITNKEIADLLDSISSRSRHVTLKGNLKLCSDPDDDMIVEASILGKAKYIVTGDKGIREDRVLVSRLRKDGIKVMDIPTFLKIISSSRRTKGL